MHRGVFQFTHTLPLPSPHKQRSTHVSRIFFLEFQFFIGWGEGELQGNFEKDALFYGSLCTHTPPSPLQFLVGGGESAHRLFYEGDHKLQKVMNTIINKEIMNNFPIVAISTTIIFLPPMLASLYFYSFPSSTTTTTFPLFSHHHHYHHKKHNLPEKIAIMYFIDHQHEKTKKENQKCCLHRPDNSTC